MNIKTISIGIVMLFSSFVFGFEEQLAANPQTNLTGQTFTSISASKQFIVQGTDSGLNSAIASKADQIRNTLVDLLKIQSNWKYPISIRLFGSPGDPTPTNPIRTNITLVDKDPSFSIYIHVGKGIKIDELERAINATLLYEMSLRKLDMEALPDEIMLPPWLLYGIEQAVLWKTDQASRDTYAALFDRHVIMEPDELLVHKNPETDLDATTMTAYKASCGALVMCLISQKGGEEGMTRVLDESILGSDSPKNLIKRNFPQLTLTPTSLHKWWTLQLATMSTPPVTESLSIPDTEQRLQEALALTKYNPDKRTSTRISVDQIEEILQSDELKKQLPEVTSALVHLSNRCFPSYRPIIIEYSRIILEIQTGRIRVGRYAEPIKDLITLRKRLVNMSDRCRDYLDWYEFNTRTDIPNSFDSYIRTMQVLREQNHELNTPISAYLKDIEKLHTQRSASHILPVSPQ